MIDGDSGQRQPPILVSACLLGVCCRWNAGSRKDRSMEELIKTSWIIPVCPEQLGGLPTPRSPAQIIGGTGDEVLAGAAAVIDGRGKDVTSFFLKGARETLAIVKLFGVSKAILCDGSPSCGVTYVKKGLENVPGTGVTAALLKKSGITVDTTPGYR